MKRGDKIRVLQMEDHNGIDTQATRMNGNTYTVDFIDDAGQIHLQESGLAIIPKVDKYVVIEVGKGDDSIRDYDREIMAVYDVVTDYIRLNDYIEEDDGLYLTEENTVLLIPKRGIPVGGEGTFFPIKTLIRRTTAGLYPDVDAIEELVSIYVNIK